MANKSITQQISECKNQLEQAEKEREQLTHQIDKIKARDRQAEQKKRTRRLIEKGAILESIDSTMAQLEGEYLTKFLRRVFLQERPQEYAKIMLNKQNNADTQ